MSADLIVPIIASLGWLVLVSASLASYRLEWNRLVKMALVWLAIFVGLYVLVEWFMVARGTASATM